MQLFASHFCRHILKAAKQMVIKLMSPFAHSRLFVIYSWESKRGAPTNAVHIIQPLHPTILIGTSLPYFFKQLHSDLDVKGGRQDASDWMRITWQGQVRNNSIQRNSEERIPEYSRAFCLQSCGKDEEQLNDFCSLQQMNQSFKFEQRRSKVITLL